MKPVTDEGFIEIGGQVAMPEETVADLLDVSIERLHELSKSVDMHNREGGIYFRDGKQYFASPQVIFKVRDANDKKSADLSSQGLFQVFAKAEARLLPEQYKAKNRRTMMKVGAVLLAIFLYANFSEPSPKSTQPTPPPPPKVEQKTPEKKQLGTRYMAQARQDIERVTKHYVTDSWMLEYGEHENANGTIDSHGFIEIDSDGRKRQFWALYDGNTDELLRLKIDEQLIFTKVGW